MALTVCTGFLSDRDRKGCAIRIGFREGWGNPKGYREIGKISWGRSLAEHLLYGKSPVKQLNSC